MSLHDLYGHESLMNRLVGTIASGRFPQAVLLAGPEGVGKQRIALSLAEALFCHDDGHPDGDCKSARQVKQLSHPDLHWFVPIVLPSRATSPDKQLEEAEVSLAEAMAERRENPIYSPPDGRASHSVASVRLLQRRAGLTPFQAKRKILILGDADRLVVQESSQEAANKLLKILEEPPRDTNLILTSSRPDSLLPTIRSRLFVVRVGRLLEREVESFLIDQMDMSREASRRVAAGSEGSVTRALRAAGGSEEAMRAATRFLEAVREGPAAWAAEALAQPPWGARGGYTSMLDELSLQLRSQLQKLAEGGKQGNRSYLRAIRMVQQHREATQRNLNPQLGLAVLACELSVVL
jgi:DNA polymerase-3 subunit delta'